MLDYTRLCKKYKIRPVTGLNNKGTVFLRVDFNVPIDQNNEIVDDLRIRSTRDTINYLIDKGTDIVLASHLSNPKADFDVKYSFEKIITQIAKILECNVYLARGQTLSEIADELNNFRQHKKPRDIFMMDNIRFFYGEKANNVEFARELVSLLNIDFYVNDAFSVIHREHASVATVPLMIKHKFAGLSLLNELYMLENVLDGVFDSEKIVTAILGGKKVETKMLLLQKLATKIKNLVIVGGMANTFLKAHGLDIGESFFEPNMLELANSIKNVALPIDFIDEDGNIVNRLDGKKICDIGPRSLDLIDAIICHSDVVVWNGPAGIYEDERFIKGTNEIAKSIAKHKVQCVGGGGDTAAVLRKLNLTIDHISNGGGAFIAWLADNNLVGINAIRYCK